MTAYASAGAVARLCATAPATFDAPGYVVLPWVAIGEVTNVGEFGREFEKVEHKGLAARGTAKVKAGYDDGSVTLTFGLDEKDAGQQLLQAAEQGVLPYYLWIDRPNGSAYFVPVLCFSLKRNVGERGQITSATAVLEITSISNPAIVRLFAPLPTFDFGDPDQASFAPILFA